MLSFRDVSVHLVAVRNHRLQNIYWTQLLFLLFMYREKVTAGASSAFKPSFSSMASEYIFQLGQIFPRNLKKRTKIEIYLEVNR